MDRTDDSHPMGGSIGAGGPYRPPPDLMLDVRKKLDPGLILNPAERMVIENVAQCDHLRTETDFESGMEARRELQKRFRVYFPALPRSMAVTGRFCSAAGRATKAHGLPQQPNQPHPSSGKFLLLSLLGGLEGRSALQLSASGSSLRPSNGRSVLLSTDPHRSQG